MLLQHGLNVFHIGFCLGVFGFQLFNAAGALVEQPGQALGLFLGGIKVLQLVHQIAQHTAHFAQILGAHLAECGFGKISDLFLAGRAVLHHLLAVGHIDLFGKVGHHLSFLGAQGGILHRNGLHLFGLLLCGLLGGFVGSGVQCQAGCGRGIQRKLRGGVQIVQIQFGHGLYPPIHMHPKGRQIGGFSDTLSS